MKITFSFFLLFLVFIFHGGCESTTTKDLIARDSVVVIEEKKTPGEFPDYINEILNKLLPCDSGSADYFYKRDSSNTNIYWLSRDTNEVYLVETGGSCGMSGSCGLLIIAFRMKNDEPEILFNDCGTIDSIFQNSHNGLYDFSVNHRYWVSESPFYYRFNGKEFVEYENPVPLSKEVILAREISAYNPKDAVSPYGVPVEFEYITLGNSTYILARHYVGFYIVKEFSSENFKIINYFEQGYNLDIIEKKTRGMNDIKVWEGLIEYNYYTWDGRKYIWKERGSIF